MVEPVFRGPQRLVWTVAGLVRAVSDALANRFSVCTVRGELSAFSRAPSGHCYFCLKDSDGESALIRCAMFRRAAGMLDFTPADGHLVELRGRMALYEPRGELQFVVESMQRAGAGALFEQFLRLKAKLEAEGLFDPAGKRELPRHPRRVGVVTSLAAAALHDVLSSLARRAPHVEVIVYPCPVQGSDAPDALVRALAVATRRSEVDTLILCRGGGSLEDLWAFNDERVVRAVVASRIPVVCGVGHETDVTLCDFAADLRAPTPTAAAELATSALADDQAALRSLGGRMRRRVEQLVDAHSQRLDAASLRLARPALMLHRQAGALAMLQQRLSTTVHRTTSVHAARLDQHAARWQRAMPATIDFHRQRVASLGVRLHALDPKQVLRRGYAWLADTNGEPVQSVVRLRVGQALAAVLADGSANVQVTGLAPTPPDNDN
ncbi:exodeoxyribonuclease VII large subunit [Piscinibacter sp. XHJ-5]|uniref:exodeoxyribonuclease VII large subunit n=1 Tax=Piscinibacter sp. XHJ-5 TaxID=3037797 RepID=UPI002453331F|nr:exodeoxyribonuclease VII large subunit [Piscinibacter sp. XHJ-5]